MAGRSRKIHRELTSPKAKPAVAWSNLVALIAVIALAVTPLALLPGVFISHDVIPKVILLAFSAAALTFLFPLWSPALKEFGSRSNGRLFLMLIAAQFASLVISMLFSSQIALSFAGTVWRRFGLVEQSATLIIAVVIACMALSRPGWIAELCRFITVCGALASIYGILQYFNLDPFLDRKLYAIEYFGGISRPPSTMGHALYFSAWLVPVLFIALASSVREVDRMWRAIHALAVILAGSAIILSATRSAIGAMFFGGIFFGWRAIRSRHGSPVKYGWVPVVAALLIAAFIISPVGKNLRNRMVQWRSDLGGPRLGMWNECPGLIAQHPVFGEGPEVFAVEFRRAQSAQLSKAYPDFYNETPHNALIDAACAQGIPGMLILAGAFVLTWFVGRNADFAADPLNTGFDAAMLGILVSSMFASLTLMTSLYLWTTTGLAVALNPGVERQKNAIAWRFPQPVAIIASLILLIPGIMLAIQDASWAEMGKAVEGHDAAKAAQAYERAVHFAPGMPGYELWASREWATLARSLTGIEAANAWKMAADASARAEANGEERFSAAYQSSVLAIAASDLPRAESEARQAIRLAPNWYKGHLLLAQLLQFEGKNKEASEEATLAADLGWHKPQ
jgi:O-antigen ligase